MDSLLFHVTKLLQLLQDNSLSFFLDLIITFIGFGLALKGEDEREKRGEIESALQCIVDIKNELAEVRKQLDNDNIDIENKCYIDPLKTPVWDGLIYTNKLQLLTKLKQTMEKKGKSVYWYKQLFEIYDYINEFNKWSNLFTEKYFDLMINNEINNSEKIISISESIINSLIQIKNKLLANNINCNNDNCCLDNIISILDNLKLK